MVASGCDLFLIFVLCYYNSLISYIYLCFTWVLQHNVPSWTIISWILYANMCLGLIATGWDLFLLLYYTIIVLLYLPLLYWSITTCSVTVIFLWFSFFFLKMFKYFQKIKGQCANYSLGNQAMDSDFHIGHLLLHFIICCVYPLSFFLVVLDCYKL